MQKPKSILMRRKGECPLGEIQTMYIDVKLSLSFCHEHAKQFSNIPQMGWIRDIVSRSYRLHARDDKIFEIYNVESANAYGLKIKALPNYVTAITINASFA
jgi:hypothetical protein